MFAAVLPELVAFSHYLWPTTLFSVLCLASWCCVVLARQRQSLAFAAAAGAVFGLAVLTRETAAAMALGGAVWLLWHAPPGKRRGAGGGVLAGAGTDLEHQPSPPGKHRAERIDDRLHVARCRGRNEAPVGVAIDQPRGAQGLGSVGHRFRS